MNLKFLFTSFNFLINNCYSQYILGNDLDDNNCLISAGFQWCDNKQRCIHPWIETCPDNCPKKNCDLICHDGYQKDENNCDICHCKSNQCSIPYTDCDNEYVCPKITQLTGCPNDGIDGYTTYQLSLIIKNDNILNLYALYGSDGDTHGVEQLYMPPAYQGDSIFNKNIGGMSNDYINLNPLAEYDSWLTIGLTNGDPDNLISSIGIDFDNWDEYNELMTTNGAIFIMNPEQIIVPGNEYIIGQLTIPNNLRQRAIVNVQGKLKCDNCLRVQTWNELNIEFFLDSYKSNIIPNNCIIWNDGCNLCNVNNGIISSCDKNNCLINNNPYCEQYINNH